MRRMDGKRNRGGKRMRKRWMRRSRRSRSVFRMEAEEEDEQQEAVKGLRGSKEYSGLVEKRKTASNVFQGNKQPLQM